MRGGISCHSRIRRIAPEENTAASFIRLSFFHRLHMRVPHPLRSLPASRDGSGRELQKIAICNRAMAVLIFFLRAKRKTSGNYLTVAPKPMRPAHFLRTALLLSMAFLGAVCACADDIKSIHPTGYVTDLAGILGPGKTTNLEALCSELEQKTGAQMAVVTVRS